MSPFTQKYTLVQFFDDVKVGDEFASNNWPLHSTIIDTFAIDWSVDEMALKLTEALRGFSDVHSLAESDEYFGENGQVRVTLLARTDNLVKLHAAAMSALTVGGLVLNDPQFAGDGFLPHATVRKNQWLVMGEKVSFTELSIVDMFPDENSNMRRILKAIKLGE